MLELASPRAEPPAGLTRACDAPAALPSGAMGAGPVERAWGRDRTALAACRERHEGLRKFYRERDAALAGARR